MPLPLNRTLKPLHNLLKSPRRRRTTLAPLRLRLRLVKGMVVRAGAPVPVRDVPAATFGGGALFRRRRRRRLGAVLGLVVDVPHLAPNVLGADARVAHGGDEGAVLALGRLTRGRGLFAAADRGRDGVDRRLELGAVAAVVAEGEFSGCG